MGGISNRVVSSIDGVSGAISLASLTAFNSSQGGNGYQKLPTGTIIQYGTISGTGVTWPIAFPANCVGVATTSTSTGTGGGNNRCNNKTTTGATLGSFGDSGCNYIAIGY